MTFLLRVCCIVTLLGSIASAQTDQWKKYKYAEGNFSALFPVEPQDSVNKNENGVKSHTLMAQQNGAVFTVIYTSMEEAQKVDDATYRIFRDAVLKELPKCDVVTEQALSLPLDGYIGHWYRLNCAVTNAQIAVIGNLYWGKHYAYAVMAMFATSGAEPAATKDFVNSFAVLEPAK